MKGFLWARTKSTTTTTTPTTTLRLFLFPTLLLLLISQRIPIVECSKSYRLLSSNEIHVQLEEFKVKYPDLVRLTTSQEAYGLPSAGSAYDCPFDERNGCPNAIITIQDYLRHPIGSKSSNVLPEVLWSGCVHGNERVGPTVVVETAGLLLEAATCESLVQDGSDNGISCRATLAESGINDVKRRWLGRLVSTRRIVIVPTANALGYFRNRRAEDGIDPNRDFPYDLLDPSLCMRTIAGRTLNEVFREHLFQMALTFHGGMEVVAYEWGAPSWYGRLSPDDLSQNRIAAAYSKYGGTWGGTTLYDYGTMNDLVYYVRGGMEDWAYAASWDTERVLPCEPTTYGGYPLDKTRYNNSTLRAFNMLVESSNEKNPYFNLGNSEDLLNERSSGSGHISRNIRLSLLSADLVEPYVSIVQVNDIVVPSDIVPLSASLSSSCGGTISVEGSTTTTNNQLTISFSVGGALTIDQVELWYANKQDVDGCEQPITIDQLQSFRNGPIIGPSSGKGQFSSTGPIPSSTDGDITAGPLFVGMLEIPNTGVTSEWIVMASARVDQDWSIVPNNAGAPPGHAQQPQSHMANARTNPNWKHTSHDGKKMIQGRLDWFSQPLTVVVALSSTEPPATPVPTDVPSNAPTTTSPSLSPSSSLSTSPSNVPPITPVPTDVPSDTPTTSSLRPSSSPTTEKRSLVPTITTTPVESPEPSGMPTTNDGGLLLSIEPSSTPSTSPSSSPSDNNPSMIPSDLPSQVPSQVPTFRGGTINKRSSDPSNSVLFEETLTKPPSTSAPATMADNDSSSSASSASRPLLLLWISHDVSSRTIFSLVITVLIIM